MVSPRHNFCLDLSSLLGIIETNSFPTFAKMGIPMAIGSMVNFEDTSSCMINNNTRQYVDRENPHRGRRIGTDVEKNNMRLLHPCRQKRCQIIINSSITTILVTVTDSCSAAYKLKYI